MDIITQGLLGGLLAQSIAQTDKSGRSELKRATLVGVLAGLLADADILISSASDPLLTIEYHRHFSHSLLFIPVGAAIAFMLLWPFMRRHLSPQRLYIYCFMGYSMSGLLDASTSYGTHLFWPFSDERVAWHLISIIDPLFSLILLVALISSMMMNRRYISHAGLVLAFSYMLFGYIQLQRASDIATDLALSRGHTTVQHVVKPTIGNLLLWRSTYIHEQHIYVDAVRIGLFSDNQIYEGESVELFSVTKDLPDLTLDSQLYADIERFRIFSDGFVAVDPTQANVIGDIRYSMLPTSTKPLWGIVIDNTQPQQHADYQFFRDLSQEGRQTFKNMLFGRCAAENC